jgi:hypothetical protein
LPREEEEFVDEALPPTPPSSNEQVSSPEMEINITADDFPNVLDDPGIGLEEFLQMQCDKHPETQNLINRAANQTDLFPNQDHEFEGFIQQTESSQELIAFDSSYCPKLSASYSLSLNSMMDSSAYQDLSRRGSFLVNSPDCQLRRTNSAFSDHIAVVEHFLQKKWESSNGLIKSQESGSVIFFLI